MPRDGRFIEALGYYDPLSNPAKIQIDREKVAAWVSRGAQPSDTVRQLLKKIEGTEGAGAGMATGES
jgi:small subunit ribosomal protein S16